MQNISKVSKPLVAILICALVLRGLLLVWAVQYSNRTAEPDTQSYIQPALSLLRDHAYTDPSATRTPVYPLFIAFSYLLFGQTAVGIVALQVLISTATVLLTYLLGVRLLSRNAAMIGSILVAISVEAITPVFFVLTETLFTFLLLSSILTYVMAWQGKRKIWLVISAILIALTVLCRPIMLPFPLILAGVFVFRQNEAWRQRLYSGFVYLLVYAIALCPWVVRNAVVVGVPTVSTISSASMLYYNAAVLDAHQKNINPSEARTNLFDEVTRHLAEKGLANTEANRYAEENSMAQQIISQAPLEYVTLYIKADLNNFLPGVTDLTEILGVTQGGKGTADVLNRQGLLAAINYYFAGSLWLLWLFLPLIILLGITYLCDVVAFVVLARKGQWFPLLILGVTSLYLLFAPGAASLPRFRVPAIPYLSLLAGLGFEVAIKYLRQKFTRLQSDTEIASVPNPR
jgi:4-amino-4-deoxy-L-arabinose transferase-like glycosyltransferase